MTGGITLLRHGETLSVREGVIAGQLDVPLTDAGRRQIRHAAHGLARHGIDHVVSSDLSRARESAEIVVRELGLVRARIDARWRERHWGVRQGTPRAERRAEHDADAPPGGESEQELDARVREALREVGPRTLVVAHAGSIRAALRVLSRPAHELGAAEWLFVPRADGVPTAPRVGVRSIDVVGTVITRGLFCGRVVHVADRADLARVDGNSLVILHRVEKDVAVDALARSAAGINTTRALTAHITHGRTADRPYLVAEHWPDGMPADDEIAEILPQAPRKREAIGPLFPDPPLVATPRVAEIGGKAAGLELLIRLGLRVPEFTVLTHAELSQPDAPWLQRLPSEGIWAVRSSADVEDGADDPMSGSFASLLCVGVTQIAEAVQRVAASSFGDEIDLRLLAGTLRVRPRVSVVLQRMVESPALAGTVFLPAPNNARVGILEARIQALADGLMDGTAGADLTCRFDAAGLLVECDVDDARTRDLADRVVREAVRIHRDTGRGDLEFAVDEQGTVWWLQARPLRSVVETVDRSGFHPAAAGYYRLLAAAVAPANLTPPVHFRLVEFGDGRFGYTHGIRARDATFHAMIAADISQLERVTMHGWEVDRAIHRLLAIPEADVRDLWRLLVMHGGVQVPFSIPMQTGLMERYDSWSSDDDDGSAILETRLAALLEGVPDAPPPGECLRLLRSPIETLSTAAHDRAVAAVLERGVDQADADLLLATTVQDLRDVPSIDEEAIEGIRDKLRLLQRRLTVEAIDAAALRQRADDALAEVGRSRGRVLRLAGLVRERHGRSAAEEFRLWSEYLAMKAETNERHAIVRGLVFLRIAKSGYSPSQDEVRQLFDQLIGRA
jgi:broad specificity phosphatase PhoE